MRFGNVVLQGGGSKRIAKLESHRREIVMEGAGREWDHKVCHCSWLCDGDVCSRTTVSCAQLTPFIWQSPVISTSVVTRQYTSVVILFDCAPVNHPGRPISFESELESQIPSLSHLFPFKSEWPSHCLFLNVCLSLKYGFVKLSFT